MKDLITLKDFDVSVAERYGMPKKIDLIQEYSIEKYLTSFVPQSDKLTKSTVTKKIQIDFLEKTYRDPFHSPYVLNIAGNPHDDAALLLAGLIFCRALKKSKRLNKPAWRVLYSGFEDKKTQYFDIKPSLLVVSNVTVDSTPHKIEKLRDLLEYYRDIPRIVVSAGSDPFSFFYGRMYKGLNGCIYLESDRVEKTRNIAQSKSPQVRRV